MDKLLEILRDAINDAQETINYAFDEPHVALSKVEAEKILIALEKAEELIRAYDLAQTP